MRKWVVQKLDNDPVKIFRKIYDTLYQSLEHLQYIMLF